MKKLSIYVSVLAVLILPVSPVAFSRDRDSNEGRRIPGQYIVVLKDSVSDVDATSDSFSKTEGLGVQDVYKHALRGFSATIPDAKLKKIKDDPRVAFVSEDREVNTVGRPQVSARTISPFKQIQAVPTGVARINASANTNKGAGVVVAVIDTGIDLTHPDLAGNILGPGKSCIKGTTAKDDNGHGTHVAGTIAAIDNSIGVVGVAPQAKLIPVKVLNRNGSGTWSSVICGIDWVTLNAAALGIKVANMSLGGGGISDDNCGNTNGDALHKAICRSRDAGVTYVVAAGNNGQDSSTFVPAAYDDAVITVSALADSNGLSGGAGPATPYGLDDTFATFSNFGSVVDIGAPGVSILSTWKGGSYSTISGTSMASPHVAGAAALYISSHPGTLWSSVRDALIAAGEVLGTLHTDPSGLHPEKVLQANAL